MLIQNTTAKKRLKKLGGVKKIKKVKKLPSEPPKPKVVRSWADFKPAEHTLRILHERYNTARLKKIPKALRLPMIDLAQQDNIKDLGQEKTSSKIPPRILLSISDDLDKGYANSYTHAAGYRHIREHIIKLSYQTLLKHKYEPPQSMYHRDCVILSNGFEQQWSLILDTLHFKSILVPSFQEASFWAVMEHRQQVYATYDCHLSEDRLEKHLTGVDEAYQQNEFKCRALLHKMENTAQRLSSVTHEGEATESIRLTSISLQEDFEKLHELRQPIHSAIYVQQPTITGQLLSDNILQRIIDMAKRYNWVIIWDARFTDFISEKETDSDHSGHLVAMAKGAIPIIELKSNAAFLTLRGWDMHWMILHDRYMTKNDYEIFLHQLFKEREAYREARKERGEPISEDEENETFESMPRPSDPLLAIFKSIDLAGHMQVLNGHGLSTVYQRTMLHMLGPDVSNDVSNLLEERRRLLVRFAFTVQRAVKQCEGIDLISSLNGVFGPFMFIKIQLRRYDMEVHDGKSFVYRLAKERCLYLLPGSQFTPLEKGKHYIALRLDTDETTLEKALERLSIFCDTHCVRGRKKPRKRY